jgi:HK97 family phage prohead protease
MNKTIDKDKGFNLDALFTVKQMSEESDSVTIDGFANTTSKDRSGDVVLEEAWTKGGLNNYLNNPIVLFGHDHTQPIGEVTEYNVSNKGLHVTAEISKSAGKVYNLIKEGVLKAFSIGFRIKDADYDSDTDIFLIKDLEMYELSVVSVPMNAESIFSVRKSFDDEKDYLEYKQLYIKEEKKPEPAIVEPEPETTSELEKQIVDKDKISLTPEELEAERAKAVQDALDAIAAEEKHKEEIKAVALEVAASGTEKLMQDIEKRLADQEKTAAEALEGLHATIAEKADEIEALRKNKMSFEDRGTKGHRISQEDIDTAVLTAKAMGIPVTETKTFKEAVEKAGAHLGDMTTAADWENLFSTRLYEDIKDKTVIEPLFRNKVRMTSRTMTFPWNPEAGYAQWIDDSYYNSSKHNPPSDAASSTGTAVLHKPKDNVITAQKLAAKEYLGYEEEEDAIIAIMPLVRDAVMRRMVRSTDTDLLRGNVGAETETGMRNALIDGVATIAADVNGGADYQYVQDGAYGDPATIADLQQVRRLMGAPGLMPGDVIYVVSQSVYFDLLEDPDFRTIDVVGERATILTGQVGMINGSPVIVSDAFATDAASTVQAICFNATNYLFGELRGMMVERDRDIENQKNIIVATRRFGMTEIIPTLAVSTKRQSFCANLVRPA